LALQPASPSAATVRMMGMRIRVLEFNRDIQSSCDQGDD
jgi:hypothetical protein